MDDLEQPQTGNAGADSQRRVSAVRDCATGPGRLREPVKRWEKVAIACIAVVFAVNAIVLPLLIVVPFRRADASTTRTTNAPEMLVAAARAEAAEGDEAAIRQVLADQVAAWNRGDIEAFMQGYKDSPDTTFIGSQIQSGFRPILEKYKKGYPSKDAMGTVTFSDLKVRMLGPEHAVVTGKFRLERTVKSPGTKDEGLFSLVLEKTPQGWKIVLDHTSS